MKQAVEFGYAIKWELAKWIVAHYLKISDAAMRPPKHLKGVHCLVIHLLANADADQTDDFPFVLARIAHESVTSAISTLQSIKFQFLPDPAPGAHDLVKEAIPQGWYFTKVLCYCQPVAYELLIPTPPAATLTSLGNDCDLSVSYDIGTITSFNPRRFRPFYIAEAVRPVDQQLQRKMRTNPGKALEDWTAFYVTVLKGACHKALNVAADATNGKRLLFIVELERRTDLKASIHVAFAFRVTSCAALPHAEVQQWLRSRDWRCPKAAETRFLSDVQRMLCYANKQIAPMLVAMIVKTDPRHSEPVHSFSGSNWSPT